MAKLIVADSTANDIAVTHTTGHLYTTTDNTSLREWLCGQWAVLFSHPEHFAPHPSTPSGFITLLADDFSACGVKPIAVASTCDTAASWLDFAGTDRSVISLNDSSHHSTPVVDLPERALARTIARMTTPFVIIIDAIARCRSTIAYRPTASARNRTIEDVLRMVQVLRDGAGFTPADQRVASAVGV
jgi:alkyl hydroperoxide reductase subunit AhpC